MKKLAFGFFGTHYNPNYLHWSGRYKTVDFRNSFYNYKKYLFDYFYNEFNDIDIFISSFKSIIEETLILTYQPKKYSFFQIFKNAPRYYPKNFLIINLLESIINYSKEHNVNYDNLLLTRFDLEFLIHFDNMKNKINYKKFNNISILEYDNVICDNFYLMPFDYIHNFLSIFKKNKTGNPHHFTGFFIENFKEINYLHDERVGVSSLSSYDIIENWP